MTDKKRPPKTKPTQLYLLLGVIIVLLLAALLLFPGKTGSRKRVLSEEKENSPSQQEVPPDSGTLPVATQKPAEELKGGKPLPGQKVPIKPLRGELAIIIDDVGYSLKELRPLLDFPGPITFAILPGVTYSKEALKEILQAGKEAILHQPMEAVGGNDPGPGAIYTWMDSTAVREQLDKNLKELRGVKGINNHMGSKVTSDPRVMEAVLDDLREKNLMFIDSRTTAETVSRGIAQRLHIPYQERSVFLDNTQEREEILQAFQEGLQKAEKNGRAIMIGHVWCHELAEILLEVYPQALEEGFEFLSVSDLIDDTSE
ncbi:divergent polysaccharide deacetylase family protein [Sediminispirochaeta bajacaliforniensis]|uniref:divergent polysaccharide deacetylase family protein n=1 Tax=Sediminispirochaeta bajacaliforniensis TaxID=148 RepID=UPI0003638EC0|nr:divergent polysaccharide deacetylase family protein [Sediminispirochaeta bajacaliforniensis]